MKVRLIIHDVAHYFLNLGDLNHIINSIEPGIAVSSTLTVIPIKTFSLFDYFDKPEQCKEIFVILIHENLISAVTYNWIDHKKGNAAALIALIRKLHSQGYLKYDIKLTNEVIKQICKDTFQKEVSLSYIKHVKYNDITINYIPVNKFSLN